MWKANSGFGSGNQIRASPPRAQKMLIVNAMDTHAGVRWLSDEMARISSVALNVYKDVYDYWRNSR